MSLNLCGKKVHLICFDFLPKIQAFTREIGMMYPSQSGEGVQYTTSYIVGNRMEHYIFHLHFISFNSSWFVHAACQLHDYSDVILPVRLGIGYCPNWIQASILLDPKSSVLTTQSHYLPCLKMTNNLQSLTVTLSA